MTNIGNKTYHSFNLTIPSGGVVSPGQSLLVKERYRVRRYYITPTSLITPATIDGDQLGIETSMDGITWYTTLDLDENPMGPQITIAGQRFMLNPLVTHDARWVRLTTDPNSQTADRTFTLTVARFLPR